MRLLTIEHSRLACQVDFAVYALTVLVLSGVLVFTAPTDFWGPVVGFVVAGWCLWSLMEYVLHRFVLHGLTPFKQWHAAHHAQPAARIGAPTVLSAGLFFMLVFLPAIWILTVWVACALTLGVVVGYLLYTITHHALHHWKPQSTWFHQRKQWHANHHHSVHSGCFGVTSTVWDQVFSTTPQKKESL